MSESTRERSKKVILFYNPAAGNGLFTNHLDDIIARFQKNNRVVVPIRSFGETGIAEFLADLDKNTYQEEYSQILVAGGDGSINYCVNAMLENGIDLPLGILPAGTANDFAYYFGIPNDIEKMIEIAAGSYTVPVDVGVVNGRYFINVAAIGQVVGVSQKTDPALKNTLGVLAYYLTGLSEFPSLKPIKVKLTTNDKTYNEKMYFMVVMNGRSAGGFKNVSPDSDINDGMLDVMLFREIPTLEMPGFFVRVLHGTHLKSNHVLHFKTDKLLLESDMDLPTDIDGEHGEKLPLSFSVLHNRLTVMAPRNETEQE